MSVTDEELMAYVDGELSAGEAERVAAAVASDPSLGARVDAQRSLRALLRGHLDPVADEPVPESLTLMIAAAAADQAERDMTDAEQTEPASVIDFSSAKALRDERANRRSRPRWLPGVGPGMAIAASLVLGLVLGTQLTGGGEVVERGGRLVASGALAKGLDTRLASSQGTSLRILTSFQRQGGDYCRVYAAGATSGIACRDDGRWVLERTVGSAAAQGGEYRQAGSGQAELMTAAQDMARGEPLDAGQERQAVERKWQP